MEAMGGLEAWNNARFVQFSFRVGKDGDFAVDRQHLWDKWEGRYRFEQTTREGVKQIVLFNVNTKQGEVYADGEKLSSEAAAEAVERAHGAFINDMYWLAMPWKWLDSGVNLSYLGEKEYKGRPCDVVELSFDGVGLTPGDRYQGFVDRESGLMTHWEYALESDRTGSWDWEYLDAGGVKLAKTHLNEEGREINMGAVQVNDSIDESLFSDPAKSL